MTGTLIKPRKGKLTETDVEMIAEWMARNKSTETDACLGLGINLNQFRLWKYRKGNQPKFESILTRIRSIRCNSLISTIERAGTQGLGNRPPDWRALAWLGEKTIPQLSNTPTSPLAAPNVQITVVTDALKRAYSLPEAITDTLIPQECQSTSTPVKETPAIEVETVTKPAIPPRRK